MANMTYTEAGYQHSSQLNLAARVKMTVLTWLERSRSRRQLSELPEYLLKDIGLNKLIVIKRPPSRSGVVDLPGKDASFC